MSARSSLPNYRLYHDRGLFYRKREVDDDLLHDPDRFESLTTDGASILVEGRGQSFKVESHDQLERAHRYMRREGQGPEAVDALTRAGVSFYDEREFKHPGEAYARLTSPSTRVRPAREYRWYTDLSEQKVVDAALSMGLLGAPTVWPLITQLREQGVEIRTVPLPNEGNPLLKDGPLADQLRLQKAKKFSFSVNGHSLDKSFPAPADEQQLQQAWDQFQRAIPRLRQVAPEYDPGTDDVDFLTGQDGEEIRRLGHLANFAESQEQHGAQQKERATLLKFTATQAGPRAVVTAYKLWKLAEDDLEFEETLSEALQNYPGVLNHELVKRVGDLARLKARGRSTAGYPNQRNSDLTREDFLQNRAPVSPKPTPLSVERLRNIRVRRPGMLGFRPYLTPQEVLSKFEQPTLHEPLVVDGPDGSVEVQTRKCFERALSFLNHETEARDFLVLVEQGFQPYFDRGARTRTSNPLEAFTLMGHGGYLKKDDVLYSMSNTELGLLTGRIKPEPRINSILGDLQVRVSKACGLLEPAGQVQVALLEGRALEMKSPGDVGRWLTCRNLRELQQRVEEYHEDREMLEIPNSSYATSAWKRRAEQLEALQHVAETSLGAEEGREARRGLAALLSKGFGPEAALYLIELSRLPVNGDDAPRRLEALEKKFPQPVEYDWQVDRVFTDSLNDQVRSRLKIESSLRGLFREPVSATEIEFQVDWIQVGDHLLELE